MKKIHMTKRFWICAGLLVLGISISATSGILAKYVYTAQNESLPVTSKAFYFESDRLTEDNHQYKLNAGTNSIEFELYNYENNLRVSEVDCTYTVTVDSEDDSFTIYIDDEIATEKKITVVNAKANTKVKLENLKDGYEYKVTVKADGGYVKTLSATFSVAPAPTGFYMNVDDTNENYVILTVWTENVKGTVNIDVPAGLIPDATDPILANIKNYSDEGYGEFTFTDTESFNEAYSSRSYRFFKTASYNSTQKFTVKMGETNALERGIF